MLCLTAKRQLSHRMHSKLARDIGTVRFRGLDTDAEPDGYFFAGLTLCQQLNNFPLSRTKGLGDRDRRICLRMAAAKPLDQNLAGERRKVCLMIREGSNGP